MTKTTKPPILTADNKPVTVGMKLYCFDDCASPIKLQVLTVIEMDLGPKRCLRLRRPNKREWTWSAVDKQGTCQSQNHFLYANKEKAAAEVKRRNDAKLAESLARDLKVAEQNVTREESFLRNSEGRVKKHRADVAAAKKKVATLKKKLAAVGK